jgi:hypothetical protein
MLTSKAYLIRARNVDQLGIVAQTPQAKFVWLKPPFK